jgi:hypothetical protein
MTNKPVAATFARYRLTQVYKEMVLKPADDKGK